jgi:hypothetical protein
MGSPSDTPWPTEMMFDGSTGDPTVIAFDPGATTGWALACVHPDALTEPDVLVMDNIEHFACGEFYGTEKSVVDQCVELARAWAGAALVFEDFILESQVRSRELLSPVRVTAAFKYTMLCEGRAVEIQARDMAFQTVTDERLAAMGYAERVRGSDHKKDATKHLFTFLKRLTVNRKLLARVFPALGVG